MFAVFDRYSDDTIEALEMLDNDEKIDLGLIVALIRHIVLNEQVRSSVCLVTEQPKPRCHEINVCCSELETGICGSGSVGGSSLKAASSLFC